MEYGNMLSYEDKILFKACANLKDLLPNNSSRYTLTKIKNRNIVQVSAEVAHD